MQHEGLCPAPGDQGFSASTNNISQSVCVTTTLSAGESEPQGEDATLSSETASLTKAPGETHEADPAKPPIAPPRSWTKDARTHWQTLPREMQAYVATREQERERELRRSQNEVAAKLKRLASKEQAADQERQKYETALPVLQQALQNLYTTMFPNVTSVEDSNRLAIVDPPRFKQWQVYRKQMDMLEQELWRVRQQRMQDCQAGWSVFASEQDRLFLRKAPELSDSTRLQQAMDAAIRVLKGIGINEDELEKAWTGELFFSLRDHRIQWLVLEGIRCREQRDIAAVAKGNALDLLSPVRRLAAASARNAAASNMDAAAFIQTLEQQLATTSGSAALKLGAMLTALKQHPAAC